MPRAAGSGNREPRCMYACVFLGAKKLCGSRRARARRERKAWMESEVSACSVCNGDGSERWEEIGEHNESEQTRRNETAIISGRDAHAMNKETKE